MKKFLISFIVIWALPLVASAALQSGGKNPPLQSFPESTNPTINSNINTPGNDYNLSQEQIQAQNPDPESPEATPEEVVAAPTIAGESNGSNPNFYVALILVCAVCLVFMFAWVFYRYRIKQ